MIVPLLLLAPSFASVIIRISVAELMFSNKNLIFSWCKNLRYSSVKSLACASLLRMNIYVFTLPENKTYATDDGK